MATLTVGSGQKYGTIESAVAASSNGDTIDVLAGTYTNDFITITHDLTIEAVGGPVSLIATASPPNGKAIIDEGGPGVSVTLNGLTISGAAVSDGNGAAVRYEGGSLVMNNVTVTNNQDGLLASPDPSGTITISNSVFSNNGSGSGSTHNIYVSTINQLTVQNSTITNAVTGHDIKSRAANNLITGNVITDGTSGTASYEINLPNGGNATIQNNTIEKGPNASNPIAISYGEEGEIYSSNSLIVSKNVLTNDYTAHLGIAVRNALSDVTASVTDNTISGWNQLTSGAASASNNTAPGSSSVNQPVTQPITQPVTQPASAASFASNDPLFDRSYYLANNPDVAAAGVDPYTHFETQGWREGRDPSALFDTSYYLTKNPDVAAANINPLDHFENQGWHEGRNPDALFDTNYYLAQNPDVKAAGIDPVIHYDEMGWKEGRNPSAGFNTNAYLNANPDVKAAGVDPLSQYLSTGAAEGRAIYSVG